MQKEKTNADYVGMINAFWNAPVARVVSESKTLPTGVDFSWDYIATDPAPNGIPEGTLLKPAEIAHRGSQWISQWNHRQRTVRKVN